MAFHVQGQNGEVEEIMSLLDDFARDCTVLEKTRVPDGEGGYDVIWTDGAVFRNYQALDTTMEARIAEKQGVTSVYSAMVRRDFPIDYGDYFRDNKTGQTYRVTSDPQDKEAPAMSTIKLKYFTAERRALPA